MSPITYLLVSEVRLQWGLRLCFNPSSLLDFWQHGDPAGAHAVFVRQSTEFNMRPLLSPIVLDRRSRPPAFTASVKCMPALKAAMVEAEMSSVSPVPGLCPVPAGRLLSPKVPKPERVTASRRCELASDTGQHGVDRDLGIGPGQSGFSRDTPREIRFVHASAPCLFQQVRVVSPRGARRPRAPGPAGRRSRPGGSRASRPVSGPTTHRR